MQKTKSVSRENPGSNLKQKELQDLLKVSLKRFQMLEKNLAAMQQEIREGFGFVDIRLETLELRMAEIQSELILRKEGRNASAKTHHH